MNETIPNEPVVRFSVDPSMAARQRMLSRWGEPLFIAGWQRVLMMHFEVDPAALQRDVPFQLDLHEGHAYVSLVAFTMCGMRPRIGGRLAAWMFRPVATHDFLNVRTYVRHQGECGIHFLAEWLSSRLAVKLGPTTFGLPYRHGLIHYKHHWPAENIQGEVTDAGSDATLRYHAVFPPHSIFLPCAADSLAEWLMERYTAFNSAGRGKRFFRVWHPPWQQCALSVTLEEKTLLAQRWPWFHEARLIGAHYSPGFDEVWMGRPHGC